MAEPWLQRGGEFSGDLSRQREQVAAPKPGGRMEKRGHGEILATGRTVGMRERDGFRQGVPAKKWEVSVGGTCWGMKDGQKPSTGTASSEKRSNEICGACWEQRQEQPPRLMLVWYE